MHHPSLPTDTFTRPAGTLERHFNSISKLKGLVNREHASPFMVLQLRFPSTITTNAEDYIARAWTETGRQYPALRAQISGLTKSDTMVTVSPWHESGFRDTFSTHAECADVNALFSAASAPKRKNYSATCHWLPRPGQVVISTSHWCTDGLGFALLADAFLSTLAKLLQTGLHHAKLNDDATTQPPPSAAPPTLEDLVRKHVPKTTSNAAADADADALAKVFTDGGRSIGLPTRPGTDTATPSQAVHTAIRLDAADTAKLAHACHEQAISVTSALNAALIRTTARFHQTEEPGADAYVMFAPVDLRGPLLAAGAAACARPTGSYISGMPLRVNGVAKTLANGDCVPAKSFGELCAELSAIYSQDVQRLTIPSGAAAAVEGSDKTVNLLQLTEPYVERISALFSSFAAPGCPFPRTPVISSLGKIDMLIKPEYGGNHKDEDEEEEVLLNDTTPPSTLRLHVTDFWISCDCASPMIALFAYTWGGEFTVSASWDESYYSREFAFDVLEKVVAELGEGLNVGEFQCRKMAGQLPPPLFGDFRRSNVVQDESMTMIKKYFTDVRYRLLRCFETKMKVPNTQTVGSC